MPYETGILLGQITKTSGFDGSVLVRLRNKIPGNMPEPESVFLDIEGRPVPFIVKEYQYEGGELLRLKFDGYDSLERVAGFKGCGVYLTSGTTITNGNEPDQVLDFIVGYTVFDSAGAAVGKIHEVIYNPGQFLLNLRSAGGKELLIPFHEDLIISTDKKRRRLIMDIPDGLMDIN